MIRDVAVKVPEPDDFIAESVFPSHIIVPRCSGWYEIREEIDVMPTTTNLFISAKKTFQAWSREDPSLSLGQMIYDIEVSMKRISGLALKGFYIKSEYTI